MSYETITKEQLEAVKNDNPGTPVKVFEIFDSEGKQYGDVIMRRPSPTVIGEFEKFLDRNPMKARQILINGCLLNRQEEIKEWNKNSEEYAAVFDAAAQMLPVGKANAKNL